ncbi:allophanate hydrolase [Deinococcus malanensis]|uniref:Allophanate hydrolase n=1 Tax=Deinococcus malanensis TaxID=1706855 RepID=A0ABQ2F0P0_9DEIO|nr:allophanate hydrolase subunit 1 [Deinococcus malanensis]GGK38269.1 allophanate hydrolase [Deinococcus malanensis]
MTHGLNADTPRFEVLGDAALVVHSRRAQALRASLLASPLSGVRETVPALNVLTVLFDSLQVDPVELEAGLRTQLSLLDEEDGTTGREVIIPVVFNGQDLGWCAAHVELSTPAFIEALCNLPLEVAFLGFTPGFAFLTGLPPTFQMPRLTTPRERVPAGSVALGGPWAGVYPRETPGGWRLIGHTDAPLFDLSRPEPLLWQPGDRVRFQPVVP